MSGAESLADLACREVVALHDFFTAWFRGEDADFAGCEAALGRDFRMVTPDGAVHERQAVLERLRRARSSQPPGFTIVVAELQPLWQLANAILLGYVEQQYRDGSATQRRSMALLTREPGAPRGVVWRHLQETWMQVPPQAQIPGAQGTGRQP